MPAAVGVAPDPPGRELTRERPACADTASESWPISQGGCIPAANCGLYRDLSWGDSPGERRALRSGQPRPGRRMR